MKELWGEDPDDYDFEVRELNPDKEYTLTMSDGEHKVTLTSRLWCELIGRGKTPFYLGCSEW